MKETAKASAERTLVLRLIDEGFDKKAWHGPNLRGAIRRVSASQAVRRPGPGRHNIAEIVLHCAYWKYAARRRILGEKRGAFPLKGSNWFTLPSPLTDKTWREYVKLLDDTHCALREAMATSPWSQLTAATGDHTNGPASFAYGIALHDVYHAGQIRVLKGLFKQAAGG